MWSEREREGPARGVPGPLFYFVGGSRRGRCLKRGVCCGIERSGLPAAEGRPEGDVTRTLPFGHRAGSASAGEAKFRRVFACLPSPGPYATGAGERMCERSQRSRWRPVLRLCRWRGERKGAEGAREGGPVGRWRRAGCDRCPQGQGPHGFLLGVAHTGGLAGGFDRAGREKKPLGAAGGGAGGTALENAGAGRLFPPVGWRRGRGGPVGRWGGDGPRRFAPPKGPPQRGRTE